MELLVDTSVWVDHLRKDDPLLARALVDHRVTMHSHILGEYDDAHLLAAASLARGLAIWTRDKRLMGVAG